MSERRESYGPISNYSGSGPAVVLLRLKKSGNRSLLHQDHKCSILEKIYKSKDRNTATKVAGTSFSSYEFSSSLVLCLPVRFEVRCLETCIS